MAQSTIYIHIGTHKTGTSAIQDFLSLNRKVLEKKGFLFLQKSRRDYFEVVNGDNVVTPSKVKNFSELAKICHNKQKHVILSSESFVKIKDVSVIGAALQNSRVKIICYLRRQDDLKQSIYNQSVKVGFSEEITAYDKYPLDYYSLLENWSAAFGRDNVIVRVYGKERLKNGNSIDDFMDIFNLKLTGEYHLPKANANPRLCPEALEYVKLLNHIWKNRKVAKRFSKALQDYSVKMSPERASKYFKNHSLLTLEQRTAILEQYRHSNLLVAQQYLGWEDKNLFDEISPQPQQDTCLSEHRLDEEAILKITRYLWDCRATRRKLMQTVKFSLEETDKQALEAKKKISLAFDQMRQGTS